MMQYDGVVTQKVWLLTEVADVPLIYYSHKIYATCGYWLSSSVILNNEQIYDLDGHSWMQGVTMLIAAWGGNCYFR